MDQLHVMCMRLPMKFILICDTELDQICIKVAVQGLNIQIIHSYMVMFLWLNNYL